MANYQDIVNQRVSLECYRNPNIRYSELKNVYIPEPENLIEGYQKLSDAEIQNLANTLANYGITSNQPAININPREDHAAQKWIAEKKNQIAHRVIGNNAAYNAFGIQLGLQQDGSYNIRQSGNLTRVAALLYRNSAFKQQVQQFSEVKKQRRKKYLETHQNLQANLKALHYAERPLRNEIYELEQIDRAEFPEAATYLTGHALNYRLPSHQTMQKIAARNAIPVFPRDVQVPEYIHEYGLRQQNPPQLPPEDFRFEYVKTRKGKPTLPSRLVDAMKYAGISDNIITGYKRAYARTANAEQRNGIRQEIREMLVGIREGQQNVADINQQHRFANLQPAYQY